MPTLILFNKPFRVLSQFTNDSNSEKETLAKYINIPNVYPAGRLDYDSEGLLLLTDDGKLQAHIADPKYKLEKTYWVQVEGEENSLAIEQLRQGIELKDWMTQPAKVHRIPTPTLWDRHPPVRFRQSIPTHWLSISITEGRNRQVRRMTAAVGLPTLRLVRAQVGAWRLDNLAPGEHLQLNVPSPIIQATSHSRTNVKHKRSIRRRP